MGAVHKFPVSELAKSEQASLILDASSAPALDRIDAEATKTLFGTVRYVKEGGKSLVEFLDAHRATAREMGIESTIVELSGILDSGRLDRVLDALEESALRGESSSLTLEGLSYLRRAEHLLAEAQAELKKYTDPSASLGQSKSGGETNVILLSAVVFIGFTVVAIALLKK